MSRPKSILSTYLLTHSLSGLVQSTRILNMASIPREFPEYTAQDLRLAGCLLIVHFSLLTERFSDGRFSLRDPTSRLRRQPPAVPRYLGRRSSKCRLIGDIVHADVYSRDRGPLPPAGQLITASETSSRRRAIKPPREICVRMSQKTTNRLILVYSSLFV